MLAHADHVCADHGAGGCPPGRALVRSGHHYVRVCVPAGTLRHIHTQVAYCAVGLRGTDTNSGGCDYALFADLASAFALVAAVAELAHTRAFATALAPPILAVDRVRIERLPTRGERILRGWSRSRVALCARVAGELPLRAGAAVPCWCTGTERCRSNSGSGSDSTTDEGE